MCARPSIFLAFSLNRRQLHMNSYKCGARSCTLSAPTKTHDTYDIAQSDPSKIIFSSLLPPNCNLPEMHRHGCSTRTWPYPHNDIVYARSNRDIRVPLLQCCVRETALADHLASPQTLRDGPGRQYYILVATKVPDLRSHAMYCRHHPAQWLQAC